VIGITHIFSDIDGVLTDGKVRLDEEGRESKIICYRDLDAVGVLRRAGLKIYFVTGEDSQLTKRIIDKFAPDGSRCGSKDKGKVFDELVRELGVAPSSVCYIGDSERDLPALRRAGFSACPKDAVSAVLTAADYVAATKGGEGVLGEVAAKIIEDYLH